MLCYARPKNRMLPRKTMKRIGKQGQKWLRVRKEWFDNHPASLYVCFYCLDSLKPTVTTLDHMVSRGRAPELRWEDDNLIPCCYRDNKNKGSRSAEEYLLAEYGVTLETRLREYEGML